MTTDGGETGQQLEEAGDEASKAVRRAADVLEREVSAGLDESRRMERTALERRRLDPEQLRQVSDRFRRNAHDLIDMVGNRVVEMTGDDARDLSRRLSGDAHSLLDALVDLAEVAPDVVNSLAQRITDTGNQPARASGDPAKEQSAAAPPAKRAPRKTAQRKGTSAKATPTKSARKAGR
jgi:hypothetical protein